MIEVVPAPNVFIHLQTFLLLDYVSNPADYVSIPCGVLHVVDHLSDISEIS